MGVMELNGKFNPYRRPTPYDILGLKDGTAATLRDIGRACNDQRKKARTIPDTAERAKRMKELDEAKAQLLRPEDRVLLDFFILGGQVFVELCCRYGQKFPADEKLPVDEVLGPLYPPRRYDDLLPEAPEKLVGELRPLDLEFFDEPRDPARLALTAIDL